MKTFITIFLFAVGLHSYAQQQMPSLVNVTGEGIVNVVPDQVVVQARVEHQDIKADEVKRKNDSVVNAVIKFLRKSGVDSKNVQTSYMSLRKNYDYQSKTYSFVASQTLSITIEKLKNYEEIMSGLLQQGLNGIDGISFKSSEIEKHKQDARKKAILNARAKANEYAKTLGQKIGSAYQISEIESNNFQPVYRMEAMKMDSSSSGTQETLAPGEIEVKVRINVAFHLH